MKVKQNKSQLDINFLINCKFTVYLLKVDENDMYGIKKKL